MIWATVSSRSCSCWLSRASSSSAAKNIINLILVLAIWWCLCVESSIVLSEESVCYECILLTKLLDFALFHFVLQDQTCLLLQVSLDFQLLHSSPLWWVGYLFLVSVLGGIVGLHRLSQLQFLPHQCLAHRLWTPWCSMVCLGKKVRSFCRFWGCTHIMHFGLLLTVRATSFLLRDSCPQ